MSKRDHVPIRMCIGCRKKRKKEEMLRFIKGRNGAAFVEGKKNVDGRGFYLCPDLLCFKKAEKKEKWMGTLGLMNPLKEGLT
jgi:predicted RNA-binding protein YlxR (DUF448 family)